ncbi:cleavage stimulation factor, 3' pre-RNA, subunit 1, partial [Quaeritorhiza haematococci]
MGGKHEWLESNYDHLFDTEFRSPGAFRLFWDSQLQQYGLNSVAQVVAEASGTTLVMSPSNRLAELCHLGSIAKDAEDADEELVPSGGVSDDDDDEDSSAVGLVIDPSNKTGAPKPAPNYTTWFTTQHRGSCRCAAFSNDGKYIATGSKDSSLKVLDVSRIKSSYHSTSPDGDFQKPVIRTLYDHIGPVNDVQFHPNGMVLASCSDDQTIKL